jgi:hypothetical protein
MCTRDISPVRPNRWIEESSWQELYKLPHNLNNDWMKDEKNKMWVLYGGVLVMETVYKGKMYTKPVEFATQGTLGFIMRDTRDITLVYSEEYEVWHSPTLDPSLHGHLLERRHVENQHN